MMIPQYLCILYLQQIQEYEEFKKRHENNKVENKDLKTYKGNAYIGIDAGSTTTKLVLIDDDGQFVIFIIWQ